MNSLVLLLFVASLDIIMIRLFLTDRLLISSALFITGLLTFHTALFAFLYFLIYIPQKKVKEALKIFSVAQNYEELYQQTASLLPPEVLSVIQDLKNRNINFTEAQKQAEYLALQNQINPHFLYNTLEALRGDTLAEGLTSVASVIEALATFFRYTITDTRNLTSLDNEIEHTENYFLIQKYRFGTKINMSIQYPEDKEQVLNLLIPKLTLQPIIENSIFHGLEKKSGNGSLHIQIETSGRLLFVNIADTGIGIAPDALRRINQSLQDLPPDGKEDPNQEVHEGIALHNVSRRIKLLFGNEYGLHLYSTPGSGTDVRIILPKLYKRNLS